LGIADARVVVTSVWPVHVDTLILVQGLTDHGVYMSPLIRECHERLAHGIDGLGHERVFIARGAGFRRNFVDPSGADLMAAAAGYHVLDASRAGYLEQIATVRDARVVAGALGAALTAIAYAKPPSQAIVFAGAEMPDTFFWFLANVFGHRYREICCTQLPETHPGWHDGHLQVDAQEFGQVLENA
ncbi:MAG: glycosyltransferase 61 family protein, partial [Janthinobacterium lividum]